jgi:hypothetical protein
MRSYYGPEIERVRGPELGTYTNRGQNVRPNGQKGLACHVSSRVQLALGRRGLGIIEQAEGGI